MMLLMDFENYAQIFGYCLYRCCIYMVDLFVFVDYMYSVLVGNRIGFWNDGNIGSNYHFDELILQRLDYIEHLMLYFFLIF